MKASRKSVSLNHFVVRRVNTDMVYQLRHNKYEMNKSEKNTGNRYCFCLAQNKQLFSSPVLSFVAETLCRMHAENSTVDMYQETDNINSNNFIITYAGLFVIV